MVQLKAKEFVKCSKNIDGLIYKFRFDKDEIKEVDDIHKRWLLATGKLEEVKEIDE